VLEEVANKGRDRRFPGYFNPPLTGNTFTLVGTREVDKILHGVWNYNHFLTAWKGESLTCGFSSLSRD